MSKTVEGLNPDDVFENPVYSEVTIVHAPAKIITLSGQVGRDASGKVSSNYEDQVSQALANIETCLHAAGASINDIVHLRYYIVQYNPDHRPHSAIFKRWLGGHKPAATMIPVIGLGQREWLIEIECTAAVNAA